MDQKRFRAKKRIQARSLVGRRNSAGRSGLAESMALVVGRVSAEGRSSARGGLGREKSFALNRILTERRFSTAISGMVLKRSLVERSNSACRQGAKQSAWN